MRLSTVWDSLVRVLDRDRSSLSGSSPGGESGGRAGTGEIVRVRERERGPVGIVVVVGGGEVGSAKREFRGEGGVSNDFPVRRGGVFPDDSCGGELE